MTTIGMVMGEVIRMPGFPDLRVTRGWLYQYLKSIGWNERERGFGSIDYVVFHPSVVDETETTPEVRDTWIAKIVQS